MMDHTSGLEHQVRTLRKRSIFTLFLTWLALFFTVIGIAAGYKNFLRVHDKAREAQDDANVAMTLMPQMASKASVENWQREIRSQLISNQTQTTKELSELKTLRASNAYIETTLQEQVEQLARQQQLLNNNKNSGYAKPSSAWHVAEVRYLLKIASRHLTLNQDSKTAISALKAADRELMLLGLPNLLPIRGLIAKDIANLQAYQSVDLSTVILAIDDLAVKLQVKVNQSRLLSDIETPVDVSEVDEKPAEKTDSILKRMKARLDETVVIKRYDNKLAKRIKGDTQAIRYELIRLKLESLKLLALKSQQSAYLVQLKQLKKLLNQEHVELLDSATLAALTKLESIKLEPEFPRLLAGPLLDELLAGAPKESL